MNPRLLIRNPRALVVLVMLLVQESPLSAAPDPVTGVEAVSSKVAKDYVRARMPDGSFKPEYYAFGEGGFWGGELKDLTIDKMKFLDVAHVIAPPLAGQKYLPAQEPAKTGLLIMVYWGTTAVPPPYEEDILYQNYQAALEEYRLLLSQGGASMRNDQAYVAHNFIILDEANDVLSSGLHQLDIENHVRDRLDFQNAKMIGYDSAGLLGTDYGRYISHTALRTEHDDEVAEIEENRYFVVLMAYDFQLLWKKKKHKLLWETRFSVNERHNEFDRALPMLAQYASQYFGQPSNGLVKSRVLDANVEIGEPTLIQFVAAPKK
jgi:hypothetical protein